jgi:hypothetical protein
MQFHEASFCDFNHMKALVMTWNAGASTPYHLQHSDQDSTFFRDLLQESGDPDILVFGFQELVDLEDKTRTASKFPCSNFPAGFMLNISQKAFSSPRRRTPIPSKNT